MTKETDMKRRTTSSSKASRKKVKRIPPSAESARDEGPRLLPLGDRVSEPSKLEHYLDLADAALGLKSEEETRHTHRHSEHE
jgi:hypothetical protein